MTPEQFAYWLQGFVELTRGAAPDAAQWKAIRDHLDTVFKKVTPSVGEQSLPPKQASHEFERAIEEMNRQQRIARNQHQRQFEPWFAPPAPVPYPYWLAPGPVIC